jgi:hypothetical protein
MWQIKRNLEPFGRTAVGPIWIQDVAGGYLFSAPRQQCLALTPCGWTKAKTVVYSGQ